MSSSDRPDSTPDPDVTAGGVAAVRTIALRERLGALRSVALRRPEDTVGLRLAVGTLAVLFAYHYSLSTLIGDLGLDSPLAYLGLVPLISVGIALLLPRGQQRGPDIHDRQLDYIIGLPLVAGAVAAIEILPGRLSTVFWTNRIDLLTLPLFVFGVSVLLFGLRTTWRYRVPVVFLFLAWPLPYSTLIERTLDFTTAATIDGVKAALQLVAVATPVPNGDGSLFQVSNATKPFTVSIASACAGVNSMVGFVIVGTAFLAVVRGRRGGRAVLRKAVWLTLGLGLVWALNVLRILTVLWIGRSWGEGVAIDGFHPFIGMVTFCLAVLLILLAMPLFGLKVIAGAPRNPAAEQAKARSRVLGYLSQRPLAAKGWRVALVAVVAAAATAGVSNSTFKHFELVAGDLGAPRLASFDEQPAVVPAYSVGQVASYDWIKRYFGGESTWNRYIYSPTGAAGGSVITDVIDGTKLKPFNAYGVEACYNFHGYDTTKEVSFDLGGGVVGHALSYRNPAQAVQWNVVYWVWPVQTKQGKRYERVVLQQSTQGGDLGAAAPQSSPLKGVGYSAPKGGAEAQAASAAQARTQNFLIGFAKQVVTHQSPAAAARPAITGAVQSVPASRPGVTSGGGATR